MPLNRPLTNVNLPTILDNRTVSVRNPDILRAFRVQSEIVRLFAEYLRANDFTEIKTPKIISSGTEGGTNIFKVKYFGRTAYLAQSPQFYKQIMVGSGLERVFEVGPVFRAEHHDTVRHLNEYISMDFEMGFISDEQDIIDMQEGLLRNMFGELAKSACRYPGRRTAHPWRSRSASPASITSRRSISSAPRAASSRKGTSPRKGKRYCAPTSRRSAGRSSCT